jgi:hypothetical protein
MSPSWVGGGGSGSGMKNAQINHCAFTGNRENDISAHFLVFRKYAFTWQRFKKKHFDKSCRHMVSRFSMCLLIEQAYSAV